MKNILCYGDSNTWGAIPAPEFAAEGRYDPYTRWPGALRNQLGADYWVIEEGLSGRTTAWDDPIAPYRNGAVYLPPCLYTHRPLDLVIILLGTNDLKHRFGKSAYDIASGTGFLVDLVLQSMCGPANNAPGVLLLCPPPVTDPVPAKFADMFEGGIQKSRQLAPQYAKVAAERGVHFLNAGDYIESSPVDGIHFEAEGQRRLGMAVAEKVRAIFG